MEFENELKENNKINLNIWKNFYQLIKSQKRQFLLLLIVMIFTGALDAVSHLFTRYAIDNFIVKSTLNGLNRFIILFLLVIVVQSICSFLFIILAGKAETQMSYSIRTQGFEKLQKLSLSYYDQKAVGWLMSRMTSDVGRISEIISWGIVDFAYGATSIITIIIIMLKMNYKLALITLIVVPPLAIISLYFQKKILHSQRQVRKINSQITAQYNEDIQGSKTTKVLTREELNLEEFSSTTRKMRDASIRSTAISSLYIPIVLVFGSIGTALTLHFGGLKVSLGGISYGTLVAFISYSMQLFESTAQIAVILSDVQAAQASAERVFSLINEKPAIEDREDVIEKYGESYDSKKNDWLDIKGSVEFRDVTFAYGDDNNILKNFNLRVEAGETIALVGETGSGKSTIVNLLCRFYEPTSGDIYIDGINYKDMPLNWIHENLGYVLQTPHLFSGTIKDNIKYGKLDATDEEVVEASKLVNSHEFIIKMEKGYDTDVAQGGNLLSTGQKQLISFARAIIKKPSIFVLDEATSSIDTETEKMIQNAIDKVLEGRTSFVVAHRLSTIINSDRILVIKEGNIIEDGNHRELMKEKGYYYRLYTNQFIEEKSKEILGN